MNGIKFWQNKAPWKQQITYFLISNKVSTGGKKTKQMLLPVCRRHLVACRPERLWRRAAPDDVDERWQAEVAQRIHWPTSANQRRVMQERLSIRSVSFCQTQPLPCEPRDRRRHECGKEERVGGSGASGLGLLSKCAYCVPKADNSCGLSVWTVRTATVCDGCLNVPLLAATLARVRPPQLRWRTNL